MVSLPVRFGGLSVAKSENMLKTYRNMKTNSDITSTSLKIGERHVLMQTSAVSSWRIAILGENSTFILDMVVFHL